jgi:hypothetical protein
MLDVGFWILDGKEIDGEQKNSWKFVKLVEKKSD